MKILEIRRANTFNCFYFQNLSYLSLDGVYFCIYCAYPIKTCMNLNEKNILFIALFIYLSNDTKNIQIC